MRVPTAAVLLALLSVALAGCGDVGNEDEDGDGIYDETERDGWSILVDTMTERTRREVTSAAHDFDSDDDGLPDQEEYFLQSDPRQTDTDGDGLSDCQEVRHTNRTQCEDPDFSGPYDGGHDTDPNRADSDPSAGRYVLRSGYFTDHTGTLAGGRPESGDGISDGEEVMGYTVTLGNGNQRAVRSDPRNGDSDGDLLDDGEERFVYASDPTVADSDGDGFQDGFDLVPGDEERYRAGLGRFTLKSGGQADLRLSIILANVILETGVLQVQSGQAADLAVLEPAPLRPEAGEYSYTPRDWTLVQIRASDTRGEGRALDIATQQGGGAFEASLWWQVHDDRFSWSQDGSDSWPAAQGAVVEGADGRLELRPRLDATA